MEGLIHPRAGPTVLPSDRSHSYHPATKTSETTADLGMPRLWSALVPESYVQQPATADATQQNQPPVDSFAATSAAKQVLAAGQVFNEAMRHLETALTSSADVPEKVVVSNQGVQNALPAAVDQDMQLLDRQNSAQAVVIDPQSAAMHSIPQADRHLATACDPSELSVAKAQEPAQMQIEALQAQQLSVSNQHQKVADAVDYGYISLLPTSGPLTSRQAPLNTDKIVNTLADAESSDSQGSLPDIDSGESDSNEAASK